MSIYERTVVGVVGGGAIEIVVVQVVTKLLDTANGHKSALWLLYAIAHEENLAACCRWCGGKSGCMGFCAIDLELTKVVEFVGTIDAFHVHGTSFGINNNGRLCANERFPVGYCFTIVANENPMT